MPQGPLPASHGGCDPRCGRRPGMPEPGELGGIGGPEKATGGLEEQAGGPIAWLSGRRRPAGAPAAQDTAQADLRSSKQSRTQN